MRRIDAPDLQFDANGNPFSRTFDDIYFSTRAGDHDGLAETRTVFLESNNLPAAWQGQALDLFTIAETGFGTGLNFLAVQELFAQAPGGCRHLHVISCERYPLSRDQLRQALQPWRARFPRAVDRLIACYPLRIPGFHRIWFSDRVTLTLIFDDAVKAFGDLDACVDAWFLDGFAPGKNPGMWQADLYTQMARLSHSGTTFGSFTAAGDVRRGLTDAGFAVTRETGFGHKRHRIVGRYTGTQTKPVPARPASIAIIGAGLAGATLGQALQRHGLTCTLYDRHTGPGLNASGNRVGLINPKIDLGHAAVNDLGQAMYGFALHRIRDTAPAHLRQTGSFHAATDTLKADRQRKMLNELGWLPDHLFSVTADQTGAVTGLDLPCAGVCFSDSAMVNTHQVVAALLADLDVRWNHAVNDLAALHAIHDHIIVASAEAACDLHPGMRAVLQPMRGQVTYLDVAQPGLRCPIMAGHYVAPAAADTWVIGATFQRGRTHTLCDPADDAANLAALRALLPSVTGTLPVRDAWAQVRYTTPDRRPVMGALNTRDHVVTGLGSHGLQYGFLLAEIWAARLCHAPMPVAQGVLKHLDLTRYSSILS